MLGYKKLLFEGKFFISHLASKISIPRNVWFEFDYDIFSVQRSNSLVDPVAARFLSILLGL